MNINSRSSNIKEIKEFLHQLNQSEDWGVKGIDPNALKQFLNNHLKIIANQKDVSLHNELIQLSERINKEWSQFPEAHNLSFTIMGIAKGVLESKDSPPLPLEMWEEILSHIPPRGGDGYVRKSGLENFYPSQETHELAKRKEAKWASEELVSLKKYGNTAKQAIDYAIKNKLAGVNLSEFPDLTEEDLNYLFEKNLVVSSLIIRNAPNIQKLPSSVAGRLIELQCSGCENLQSLPELPKLQRLNCISCSNLRSLPELPQLHLLFCDACTSLQSLPSKLPQLKSLSCENCENLPSLPELPQVLWLNCDSCNLPSLPELPHVQYLSCRWCPLHNLPELPQVEELDCGNCENLQSLPELPHVQKVNYRYCKNLQNVPEFPKGVQVFK